MRTLPRLLMWIVGTALVVGCTSAPTIRDRQAEVLESFRAAVRASVTETSRADRLVALGTALHGDLLTYLDKIEQSYDHLAKLNASYDTTREQLEAAYAAMGSERQAIRERLLAARVEMLALTTADEWRALMKREKRLDRLLEHPPGWMQ